MSSLVIPWELRRASSGGSMLNAIVARPFGVSTVSTYLPACAVLLISTSTNRYVPFSLTRMLDVRSAEFAEFTRAPRRFVPRTRSLTGLIVWLAHHDGGSTLVIEGAG